MNDKKDVPGKGPSVPETGAKRPFATIDLKAVEVKAEKTEAAAAPAPATSSEPQSSAAAKVVAAGKALHDVTGAAATADTAAKDKAGAAAGKPPAAASSPREAGPSGPTGGQQAAAAARPQARQGSALGRFFTHLAAGVAGGALTLLGASQIGPQLGIDLGFGQAQTGPAQDIARRLAALELQTSQWAASQPAAADAARTASVEAGLKRIDDVQRSLAGLTEAHAKLQAEHAALREAAAKPAGAEVAAERIAKLEEQLSAMTAAAAADPQRAGRLPQLAQLTGQVADLKAAIDTRLAAQRKDVLQEIDTRIAASAEAAETAKAGTQRIDRDVTALKSDATRLTQRLDQLKGGTDRLEQTLKTTQDDTASLKNAIEALKGDLSGQIKSTAKPADVAMAVAPIAAKIATLESSVQNVVRAEEDRKSNAERIVLSLELGNLKRAMDRGQAYAAELAEVRKVAGGRVDLTALERFQAEGVPTLADLARTFRPIANAILDADSEQPDASVVDRLVNSAKTIVRVRKTSHAAGDGSAEAIVARIEAALKEARLADAAAEVKKLSAKAAAPAQDWLRKVEARRVVETALADIDAKLKSSLGAGEPKGSK